MCYLDIHEAVDQVVTRRSKLARFIQVAATELATRAGDEMLDALLGLDALVNVIVTGEGRRYAIADEERLKERAQSCVRAVLLT